MASTNGLIDVGEMKDRMMIDLFKRKLRESGKDLSTLRGTWAEAAEILKAHFGRITRTMSTNENQLRQLYQMALNELRQEVEQQQ